MFWPNRSSGSEIVYPLDFWFFINNYTRSHILCAYVRALETSGCLDYLEACFDHLSGEVYTMYMF